MIYDQVKHQPKYQAIADIKMVSLVNSQGTWTAATRRNKDKIENPGLVQQEQTTPPHALRLRSHLACNPN